MTLHDFVNRLNNRLSRRANICIVGYGVTGRAICRHLLSLDCCISARTQERCVLPPDVKGFFGEGYLCDVYEDVLILSPSVRRDCPALLRAEQAGTVITSDCEIFYEGIENNLAACPQIFNVTGSDGKTTVTNMAARMLSAEAVGNIGTPFCDKEGFSRYVAELSSFNLNFFAPPSIRCAVTNITPNHLNWHNCLEEYTAAKANVLKNASHAVLCADDAGSHSLMRGGETLFSVALSRGELIKMGAEHAVYLDRNMIYYDSEPILPSDALALKERHNVLNFMAAVGLSFGYTSIEKIQLTGAGFVAPPHRCEHVHTDKRGVIYVNSSIDTTPARTATTLAGLDRPVRLLLGGSGKGLSPMPLREPLLKYADTIALYGEYGQKLTGFIDNDSELRSIPHVLYDRFEGALNALCDGAREGQTVLLSPAATAYGEFENYEKRGEFFTLAVKNNYP